MYDFWGFPSHYYQVTYPAPGAPDLAVDVVTLLGSAHHDPRRGLDHGAYVPLVEMYPEADVPVLQISMPSLDPIVLLEVGRRLAPLRDHGVLIVGSGFTTHNLRELDPAADTRASAPSWSVEFDDWVDQTVATGDVDALLDFQHKAPAARLAHPGPSTSHRCSWPWGPAWTRSTPARWWTASGTACPSAPSSSTDQPLLERDRVAGVE